MSEHQNFPTIAIIGRPNVGKSSLFNTLLNKKKSLVADTPGVTRDIVEGLYQDEDLSYSMELLDTGGISAHLEHDFIDQTIEFAKKAIERADILLFVVDSKEGITQDDQLLTEMIRKHKIDRTILVVNKVDNSKNEVQAYEFYGLGFPCTQFISTAHRLGIVDLKEKIRDYLTELGFNTSSLPFPVVEEESLEATDSLTIKCALLGRPNAGKSSFFNRVIGEEKAIVSDIPGTTRDVLTKQFSYKTREYEFADTAGFRRRARIVDSLEQDSIKKALWAIRKSDIVILLLDASLTEVMEQDKKLLDLVIKEKKGIIIGLNKWDLIEREDRKLILDRFEHQLNMVQYYPIVPFSTTVGKSIFRILDVAAEVSKNYHHRLKAKELTLFLKTCIKEKPPFSKLGVLKIFYGAQVGSKPPQFDVFVNNYAIITPSYKRYLMNRLYEEFPLRGVPLFLYFKNRH